MCGLKFVEAGMAAGLVMKEKHTIVEAWPMKFNFGLPTAEARKEFSLLLGSSYTG